MYVCIYACVYMYICTFIYIYIHVEVTRKTNKFEGPIRTPYDIRSFKCVCVCIYMYMFVHMYVYIYICICICICVSTYPTYQWILTVLGALNVATRHGGSAIVFARPDPSPTDGCGLKLIAVQCQVTCETSDFAKIGDEHTSILKIDIQHCSNAWKWW